MDNSSSAKILVNKKTTDKQIAQKTLNKTTCLPHRFNSGRTNTPWVKTTLKSDKNKRKKASLNTKTTL